VQSPGIAWSFDESGWNGTTGEVQDASNSLFVLNGIGAADAAGASAFTGAIDEVALRHAPLSPEDLITLRGLRHTFGGNKSPLVTNPGTQNSQLNAASSCPIPPAILKPIRSFPALERRFCSWRQRLYRLLVRPTHRQITLLDPQRHHQPSFPKSYLSHVLRTRHLHPNAPRSSIMSLLAAPPLSRARKTNCPLSHPL